MIGFVLAMQAAAQPQWNPRSVEIPSPSTVDIEENGLACSVEEPRNEKAPMEVRPCNLAEWRDKVTGQYPYRALQEKHEGTVRIEGVVRPNGRFSDCNVVQSSGSNVLDQKACRSIVENAQFEPARDANGNAVPAMFKTSVTYRLPEWPDERNGLSQQAKPKNVEIWAARIQENYPTMHSPPAHNATVELRALIAPNGRAVYCDVTQSSGWSILDSAACLGMLRYSRFDPALDRAGQPTTGIYETEIKYWFNQG